MIQIRRIVNENGSSHKEARFVCPDCGLERWTKYWNSFQGGTKRCRKCTLKMIKRGGYV